MEKRNKDFEQVFQKYYRDLCIFAYRYVASRDVAEDIVQELFCRLLESGTTFREEDGEVSLRSYLYTCTRNRSIDFIRNVGNRHCRIDDFENSAKLDSYVDNILINRIEEYDYRVLLAEVQSAIFSLPMKTKRVFLMSRVEKKSNKEIAASLGVTVKAIEKHMTKAITLIRAHVQERLEVGF